jgi:DNA-directed RNA polymerase specialized sigma24 family protein
LAKKVTSEQLNRLHALFVEDPEGQNDAFWSALRNYVERCLYVVTPRWKDDLVQDITVAIIGQMDRFRPGADFQKYVSGIIRNMRARRFRDIYSNRTLSFSQLGQYNEEGEFTEYDPSELDFDNDVEDDLEFLDPGRHARMTTVKLDAIRGQLKKPADIRLFDLLRSGLSLEQAAMRMGATYSAVQSRFFRMREKFAGKCLIDAEFGNELSSDEQKAA